MAADGRATRSGGSAADGVADCRRGLAQQTSISSTWAVALPFLGTLTMPGLMSPTWTQRLGGANLDPKYGDGGAGAVGQLQGELKAGVALGDVDCVERGAAKVRWGDIRRAHVLD